MRDTRINEKRAEELIKEGKQMIFRLLLQNGNVVERIIRPVKVVSDKDTIYRDIRNFYAPKKEKVKDVKHMKMKSLRKIESVEMPSRNGSVNNTIEDLIVSLLDMGYEYIK